jgi:GTP cyclohydrolase I
MEASLSNKTLKTYLSTSYNGEALDATDDEKIEIIQFHFSKIMETLGLDLTDDSLCDTPNRVANMYVQEIFSGLNLGNKPEISLFENNYGYRAMLVEKDITLYSICEHHFVPIIGRVHVAYIPDKQIIGLSKINRLVQYYAKRPQVQERLTIQIADELKNVLRHDNVAVVIEADHLCVASRGIKDTNSVTTTAEFSGKFENQIVKQEFLSRIYNKY